MFNANEWDSNNNIAITINTITSTFITFAFVSLFSIILFTSNNTTIAKNANINIINNIYVNAPVLIEIIKSWVFWLLSKLFSSISISFDVETISTLFANAPSTCVSFALVNTNEIFLFPLGSILSLDKLEL